MNNGKTFAEFFAGIGLVRVALEELGWQCAFSNDIDRKKAKIYEERFGGEHHRVCDVAALERDDVPAVTMATASFPCTDLSLAGNRAGLSGRESGAFWPFMQLLKSLSEAGRAPEIVLLENVVGFLSSNNGNDFVRAIAALNDRGYICDAVVIDAAWFLPQSRKRLFILAAHEGSSAISMRPLSGLEAESPLRPAKLEQRIMGSDGLRWGRVDFPHPPRRTVPLRALLDDLPDNASEWWDQERTDTLLLSMRPLDRERTDQIRASQERSFGTVYRRTRYGKTVAEVRTDGRAGCLRTARGGSSKQFLLVGGRGRVRVRNMTSREYARLQGVPDSFELGKNENLALSALGDAVCVPAVKWLAENALEANTSS